jgi:polysaccharide biosynthesis protein PslH
VVGKPRLLFVSTRFLFPVDSGGKIRTTQVLRGLLGGTFDITLASPAPAGSRDQFAAEIATVCNRFIDWPELPLRPWRNLARLGLVRSKLPIPIATDRSQQGSAIVAKLLAERPTVVVFDFPHSFVLAPSRIDIPCVMFTHNVEAEIFARHAKVAKSAIHRTIWQSQYRKMLEFEKETLRFFDTVIAVAERLQHRGH